MDMGPVIARKILSPCQLFLYATAHGAVVQEDRGVPARVRDDSNGSGTLATMTVPVEGERGGRKRGTRNALLEIYFVGPRGLLAMLSIVARNVAGPSNFEITSRMPTS